MDAFVVHLLPKSLVGYNLSIPYMGRNVTLTYRVDQSSKNLPNIHDVDLSNYGDRMWYCEAQEHANILAEEIANQNPGRMVQIYTLQTVMQCPPGKVVKSKFTEKGLVPA